MYKYITKESITVAVLALFIGGSIGLGVVSYMQSQKALEASSLNKTNTLEIIKFLNDAIEQSKE